MTMTDTTQSSQPDLNTNGPVSLRDINIAEGLEPGSQVSWFVTHSMWSVDCNCWVVRGDVAVHAKLAAYAEYFFGSTTLGEMSHMTDEQFGLTQDVIDTLRTLFPDGFRLSVRYVSTAGNRYACQLVEWTPTRRH